MSTIEVHVSRELYSLITCLEDVMACWGGCGGLMLMHEVAELPDTWDGIYCIACRNDILRGQLQDLFEVLP